MLSYNDIGGSEESCQYIHSLGNVMRQKILKNALTALLELRDHWRLRHPLRNPASFSTKSYEPLPLVPYMAFLAMELSMNIVTPAFEPVAEYDWYISRPILSQSAQVGLAADRFASTALYDFLIAPDGAAELYERVIRTLNDESWVTRNPLLPSHYEIVIGRVDSLCWARTDPHPPPPDPIDEEPPLPPSPDSGYHTDKDNESNSSNETLDMEDI